MELTDSHVHLDWFPAEALDGVVRRAVLAGVVTMVTVGTDLESSRRAVEIAGLYPSVLAAVGLHPAHLTEEPDEERLRSLAELARNPRVVAVGEIGLDLVGAKVPVSVQERVFRSQLRLARELELPLLLHVRGAFQAAVRALEEEGVGPGEAANHYFIGSGEEAEEWIARGVYLSLGKPLLRSAELQELAARIPLRWLLTETDAYPRKVDRWTEPADVRLVAERLATVRGMETEALVEAVSCNLRCLLHLDAAWRR